MKYAKLLLSLIFTLLFQTVTFAEAVPDNAFDKIVWAIEHIGAMPTPMIIG